MADPWNEDRGRFDTDEIKRRLPLDGYVERATNTAPRHVQGKFLWQCPRAQDHAHGDRNPSFTVRTWPDGRQTWRCWSVHTDDGGDLIDFYAWLHGVRVGDAIKELAREAGVDQAAPDWKPRPRPVQAEPAPRRTPGIVDPAADRAGRYEPDKADRLLDEFLALRGWTQATAAAVGLEVVRRYNPVQEQHCPYVRFPFMMPARPTPEAWYYQDRAQWPDAEHRERWLSAPKTRCVIPFGWHRFGGRTDQRPVFVTEGPTDATTLIDVFGANVVAFGIPGTGAELPWLRGLAGREVYLVIDPGPAGDDLRARVTAGLEAAKVPVRHIHVPTPEGEGWDIDTFRGSTGDDVAFCEWLFDACAAAGGLNWERLCG